MSLRLFLCHIGLHRPMTFKGKAFTDVIVGRTVCDWECACGRKWMAFRGFDWGFRCEKTTERSEVPEPKAKGPHPRNPRVTP